MLHMNNARFIASNSNNVPKESVQLGTNYRKCAHHIHSYLYAANMRQHQNITKDLDNDLAAVNTDSTINIKVAVHFMAPNNSYNKDKVMARMHDVLASINDDFNNYSTNPNTMNNFKYKSIINQIFLNNMQKQNIYLSKNYTDYLPTQPSNITFELGNVFYYPIANRLSLIQYHDIKDIELEHQAIKQYIHNARADAIEPEYFLNIWIVDMADTNVLGFANFPWESIDNYHGIVIHRRVLFPEDYGETYFDKYKTFTHQIGHYLGLLHVMSNESTPGALHSSNIHADNQQKYNNYVNETPNHVAILYNPMDQAINRSLHTDANYNPLFMDFMDCTSDRYVSIFTKNQIQKMRYMINIYRPKIDSSSNGAGMPLPKYNPTTNTIATTIDQRSNTMIPHTQTVTAPKHYISKAPVTIAPIAHKLESMPPHESRPSALTTSKTVTTVPALHTEITKGSPVSTPVMVSAAIPQPVQLPTPPVISNAPRAPVTVPNLHTDVPRSVVPRELISTLHPTGLPPTRGLDIALQPPRSKLRMPPSKVQSLPHKAADKIDVDPTKNDNIYDRYTSQMNKGFKPRSGTKSSLHMKANPSKLPAKATTTQSILQNIPPNPRLKSHMGANIRPDITQDITIGPTTAISTNPLPRKAIRQIASPKTIYQRTQPISSF